MGEVTCEHKGRDLYLVQGLTSLLTPRNTVLLEKLIGFQLVKNFPTFHGTHGSLPHSQVPATCPYPDPARSSPYPTSHFLKILFNIILPSTPGFPKWSLTLAGSPPETQYKPPFPHTRYMSRPSHASRVYHPNNIG